MKKYYKVVNVSNKKKFYSCSALSLREKYALQYAIGKTTVPKMGYIYVFETLLDAVDFANYARTRPSKILIGYGKKVRNAIPIIAAPNTKAIEHFWKRPIDWNQWNPKFGTIEPAPIGTIWLKSFMPIRIAE